MSYDEVIKKYENNPNDYRLLMMKLSKNNSFEVLIKDYVKILPETDSVFELFQFMKGEWEIKCGRGNRVYDEKIYDNKLSKDCAVLFTIRVLSNNLTSEDKKHFYNVYTFIQTHPNLFGDRIRYHVRNTLEKKLTQKQQRREKIFKLNINDYSESDTDSNKSEPEICENCEEFYDQNYACACYD
jgi:hypothetical protein